MGAGVNEVGRGNWTSRTWLACRHLIVDATGEDLVEYALLTAFIGLAGAAVLSLMAGTISAAYTNWDSGTQGLAAPPDPAGS